MHNPESILETHKLLWDFDIQTDHQRTDKGIGRIGNKSTSGDHPDYNIVRYDRNTEKSA